MRWGTARLTASVVGSYHAAVVMERRRLQSLARFALLGAGLSLAPGCGDAGLAGLAGQWVGTFACGDQLNDVRISVEEIIGEALRGTAVVRAREVDERFVLSGTQRSEARQLPCLDDRCGEDADCVGRGGGRCSPTGLCASCVEERRVTILTLTLSDENVSLADPRLDLVRVGDTTLDGSVQAFCGGAGAPVGTVVLRKR